MSVKKMAASDTRKASMPHWAAVRYCCGATGGGIIDSSALPAAGLGGVPVSFTAWPSLVLPVRVVGVLEVPQRPPAAHLRDLLEVVPRRRRRRHPLQRPGVPRVVAGPLAVPQRPEDVEDEQREARHLDEGPDGAELVPEVPAAVGVVGVDA